ncbi:MAG: M48 family metallopeptidase [Candidatus Sericytochromatia bacterium]|nr:M48 family metallopeptidase [Candidatus Sericytochromatia bacterium]
MKYQDHAGPMLFRDRGDWMVAGLLLGLLSVLAGLVFWGLPRAGRLAVRWIPPEWERRLGDSALSSVVAGKAEKSGIRVAMAQAIVERLIGEDATWSYRVTIAAEDPQVNAMALPGGAMVVTQGMLQRCESPEELAGVLAHEIVHVRRRHGVQRMGQQAGLNLLLLLLTGGDPGGLWSGAAGLTALHHDRAAEEEADREGFALMVRAQLDPSGMVRVFRTMQAVERESGQPRLPDFLSDHPDVEARLAWMEAEMKRQSGPWRPLALPRPWLNMKFPSPAQ